MFYNEGIKVACTRLGLIKEALSAENAARLVAGLAGTIRGTGRGALTGGVVGALAGDPEDRLMNALRGAGYGALLGGAAGGAGSGMRAGRVGRAYKPQIEQALAAGKRQMLPREAYKALAKTTRPRFMGPTAMGALGGFHGVKNKEK